MHLEHALGLRQGEMVSLIGAGGKTTTLFRLAKELRDKGGKVLLTTTTKMFKPTKPHVDRLFLVEDVAAFLPETAKIRGPVIVGAGYRVDDEDKLIGLPSAWLDRLEQSRQFDSILVEADSAASRFFKVPSEIEPVVPKSCHLVIWVMAIKVIGQPLDPRVVYRTERAVSLLGVTPGTQLTAAHVLQLVIHPQGCLKGIPFTGRKVALLNQADSPDEIQRAKELAQALVHLDFERVVIASFLRDDPVEEVVMP
ncbi:MAG TPA: selenium cofactor biosynthesis protein YqeC [Methylomirabilota bacterium]|nr:selenium cofactor biosynthesis protein YqeC [Methylomirabilota bacterium]